MNPLRWAGITNYQVSLIAYVVRFSIALVMARWWATLRFLLRMRIWYFPHLEDWRRVIVRHNLTEQLSLPDWIPILKRLAAALISHLQDLTAWPHAEISPVADKSPNPDAILGIFRATLVVYAPVPSATPWSSWQLVASAHSLADGIWAPTVSDTVCARSFPTLRNRYNYHRNSRFWAPQLRFAAFRNPLWVVLKSFAFLIPALRPTSYDRYRIRPNRRRQVFNDTLPFVT